MAQPAVALPFTFRLRSPVEPARAILTQMCAFVATVAFAVAGGLSPTTAPASLDNSYRQMYNLEFADAHNTLRAWEAAHPGDPMGPVSDAAAYLFAEFDRLHILQSELFTDDTGFKARAKPKADQNAKQAFLKQ